MIDFEKILNQVIEKVKETLPKNNEKEDEEVVDYVIAGGEEVEENQDFSNLSDAEILEKLPSFIDHTILKADANYDEINKIINEAIEYKFCSVCVNSYHTSYVAKKLKGSGVKTCVVVGFPLGAMSTKGKAYETKTAVEDGADEIDMVINIGALKNKDFATVLTDISAVVKAAGKAKVKVILETCLLTEEEKMVACTLSKTAKAHFVKTSTGFSTVGTVGATVEDIALMRKLVGPKMGVKASGGVKTQEDAMKMIKAGANRIGASKSVTIVSNGIDMTKGNY